MITCASCGTTNRNGSKYCSHCGEVLTANADNACPACGQLSACGSIECHSCGRALTERSPVGEGSGTGRQLVESPDTQGSDTHRAPASRVEPRPDLPPWLYPSSRQAREEAPKSTAQPPESATQPPSAEDASRYLKGIRGVLPDTDGWLGSALSDYLADEAKDQSVAFPRRRSRAD
jgi:hypothetical protein